LAVINREVVTFVAAAGAIDPLSRFPENPVITGFFVMWALDRAT